MPTHEVYLLHVTINVPLEAAYAFAHRPENFPKWAAGLSQSLHPTARGWIADTPQGLAEVEFSTPNNFGILDHRVHLAGQPEIYVPLRLLANGSGTEAELALFRQPGMTDGQFARDAELVTRDLAALKQLLESGAT